MTFSLKDHLGSLPLQFEGVRQQAWERATASNLQKRDILWLQRLNFSQNLDLLTMPEGWGCSEDLPFEDEPSHKNEKSVFYWLQHALYHVGLVRTVKAGHEETIQLPSFDGEMWPHFYFRIEEGATVTVIDDYALSPTDKTPFRSVTVEVGPRAQLKWCGYQHHSEEVISFDHKRFVLHEGARTEQYHHVLGGRNSFEEILVDLRGNHSEVHSQVVFFGYDNDHQEMRVNHMHVGKETRSHMISKGAVTDRAHSGFLGYIQMEPGCDGADGNLEEHNLLLSGTSKIDAVPGLEIGHHNVAAAHSAYMERVDDEKLFYLASRGIPKEEAIELIVEGFFWDAIQSMHSPELEGRLFDHIRSYL